MKYTRFTGLTADEIKGAVFGTLSGAVLGGVSVSRAADYTLTAAEVNAPYLAAELTAASKSIVLGVSEGQMMLVANVGGTNAFTVKGRTGDSGTSLSAGKVALVLGSATANATKIYVLN